MVSSNSKYIIPVKSAQHGTTPNPKTCIILHLLAQLHPSPSATIVRATHTPPRNPQLPSPNSHTGHTTTHPLMVEEANTHIRMRTPSPSWPPGKRRSDHDRTKTTPSEPIRRVLRVTSVLRTSRANATRSHENRCTCSHARSAQPLKSF